MARIDDLWHTKDRRRTARYGKGKRWQAVITVAGVERKRSFPVKAAAEAFIADAEAQVRSGDWVDPRAGLVLVSELIPEWRRTLRGKESYLASMDSTIDHHLLPWWGDKVLADIDRTAVEEWLAHLTGKYPSRRTVQTYLGRLNLFLRWCGDVGRIRKNPCAGIRVPKGARRPHVYLTPEQFRLLIGNVAEHYRPMVWVLVNTGLRIGEACELRVKDVDLDRARLWVRRAVVYVGGRAVIDTPKSNVERTVALNDATVAVMRALTSGKGPDDLVFTSTRGTQVRADNFRNRVIKPAVSATRAVPAILSTHDLRHTFASWAVAAGASVKSLQRMVGHAKASVTLDIYAGLFDQDLTEVASKVGEKVGWPTPELIALPEPFLHHSSTAA